MEEEKPIEDGPQETPQPPVEQGEGSGSVSTPSAEEITEIKPEQVQAPEPVIETKPSEIQPEVIPEEKPVEAQLSQPSPPPPPLPPSPPISSTEIITQARKELLSRASQRKKELIQKRKEKILEYLQQQGRITNDEVEKLIRVKHRTATYYLERLEKEGKIEQVGKVGWRVFYRLKQ